MAKLYTITLNGVTEDTYNKATDYIQANALRLNYRPAASTIDAEFPDDIDPAKAPELAAKVRRCLNAPTDFFSFVSPLVWENTTQMLNFSDIPHIRYPCAASHSGYAYSNNAPGICHLS